MAAFTVDQPQQLQNYLKFNKTLSQGGEPGPSDASIFFTLTKKPDQEDYPNLCKWYMLMSSLSFSQLSKLAQDFNSINAAPTAYLEKPESNELTAPKQPQKYIAKSIVIFDVKFYEADCNIMAIAHKIYQIQMNGLVWNKEPKIIPVAFGVCKLQIGCVIEDDKVISEDFIEIIQSWEEDVLSVDIVAFQKL